MNVIHLEDEPWDSGIAHYAATLAAEQARRGHRVAFWGAKGSPVLDVAAAAGLPTRGWARGPAGWLDLPALRREMRAFSPSVVNAHTGSSHALAVLLAPEGAAVVRTRGDARPPASNALTRWTAGRTAAFIAANADLRGRLETAFPRARVRLVPQGVAGPGATLPLPDAPAVGIIARLDPVKGHDVLLDAAKILKPRFPALRLLCAGEGRLLECLQGRLPSLGLGGAVQFLGHVPDKWAFVSGCRIGVVSSVSSEAVSRAALEWMAAGRPLAAARVGGLPDIVDDGITGLLVPPGDPESLARALGSLLADPARAEAMGQAARRRWEDEFSLPIFYRRTQDVYDEAINDLPR